MAIKSNIISTINGFITAIVTVTKVRSSFDTIVDNIYPTPILDTQDTTNIATKMGINFTYNLQFTKTGRNIHLCGRITNVSGSVLNSVEEILEVTNTEFEPYTNYTLIGSNSNGNVDLSFSSDALALVSSMGVGETIIINQTYQSLN